MGRTALEESLRDRLASLSRRELVALAVVVVVTLVGGAVWYVRSLPRPVDVVRRPGAVGLTQPVAAPAATPSPSSILVHVAGEVRRPGVYEFREGDRVIDAIDAAGGARGDAALDELNLAAPLTDGSQVLVPGRSAAAPASIGGSTTSGAADATTAKINVNTADAAELEELPGIGEVLSQAIVDYRAENGPFSSVDELEDVSGIGPAILEDVRDLVGV
jgi:competence protein ComEA